MPENRDNALNHSAPSWLYASEKRRSMNTADTDLAKRIETGDTEALRELVDLYFDGIYRFLRHLTGHREEAEDLSQQTLLRARSAMRSFKGRSSLKTWLHRIAFHEYTHWKRRRRRQAPFPSEITHLESGFREIDHGEALLAALHRLSDPIREAFLLHEIQELSVEEVAKVVGSPVGTVKSRLSIARTQLRQLLEETYPEVRHEPRIIVHES